MPLLRTGVSSAAWPVLALLSACVLLGSSDSEAAALFECDEASDGELRVSENDCELDAVVSLQFVERADLRNREEI